MQFDVNETLAGMMGAMQKQFSKDWPLIKSAAHQFLQARILRLALLAELRLTGQLSPAFFAQRMNDEQLLLQSELHAITIVTLAAAQRAARAALQVFTRAVDKALPI